MRTSVRVCTSLAVLLVLLSGSHAADNSRTPRNDDELVYWLTNMVSYHGFSLDEVQQATGLSRDEIQAALRKHNISPEVRPARAADAPLLVLPYPGGRHPRIGFLEGAIDPQRETKVSVFTPWNDRDYVVLDIPEAIWSNLGLTYLAHTHVDTIWTKQGIALEQLEWTRGENGRLKCTRVLPNKIKFTSEIVPHREWVQMRLTLKNGTDQPLSDLRVQNCVMLKGADGFQSQTNENKLFEAPYAACRSADGSRWVITAWEPCHKSWGNKPSLPAFRSQVP